MTQTPTFTWHGVINGAHKGILIAPTLIAFGLGVGLLAASKGLSVSEIALMSAWVYAGGAQMATCRYGPSRFRFALVLTVLAMNARYILLSASLRPVSARCRSASLSRAAFFGDGNWVLPMREFNEGRRPDAGFLLGSGCDDVAVARLDRRRPSVRADPRRPAPVRRRLHAGGVLRHHGGRLLPQCAQRRAAAGRHRGRGRGPEAAGGALVYFRRRARRQSCGSLRVDPA